jgi:hypothetical protein
MLTNLKAYYPLRIIALSKLITPPLTVSCCNDKQLRFDIHSTSALAVVSIINFHSFFDEIDALFQTVCVSNFKKFFRGLYPRTPIIKGRGGEGKGGEVKGGEWRGGEEREGEGRGGEGREGWDGVNPPPPRIQILATVLVLSCYSYSYFEL